MYLNQWNKLEIQNQSMHLQSTNIDLQAKINIYSKSNAENTVYTHTKIGNKITTKHHIQR